MPGTKRLVILQRRDLTLLWELGTILRAVDREQASVVTKWKSVTRANSRLLLLYRAGWLDRFFVGTINGGRRAIYTLSRQGAIRIGAPYRGIRRKAGRWFSSDLFVEHQLHVNSILLAAKYGALPSEQIRFLRSQAFYEPICAAIPLQPDGYFEMETPRGISASFIEIDLGNEPQRIWRAKIQRYVQLAISGEFAKIFNQPQFRVLVIADSGRRAEQIRRTAGSVIDKIFWFTSFESIHRDGLWSPIWIRPTGERRHSLL